MGDLADARCIDQPPTASANFDLFFDYVPSGPRHFVNDGAVSAEKGVKERRLSGIRFAREDQPWRVSTRAKALVTLNNPEHSRIISPIGALA